MLNGTVVLITETFFPEEIAAQDNVTSNGGKLVHYTSADTALKIINNEELWLRDTSCMNDSSEIIYGEHQLTEAFKRQGLKDLFFDEIRSIYPNFEQPFQ